MYTDGMWHDNVCDQSDLSYQYICEKKKEIISMVGFELFSQFQKETWFVWMDNLLL